MEYLFTLLRARRTGRDGGGGNNEGTTTINESIRAEISRLQKEQDHAKAIRAVVKKPHGRRIPAAPVPPKSPPPPERMTLRMVSPIDELCKERAVFLWKLNLKPGEPIDGEVIEKKDLKSMEFPKNYAFLLKLSEITEASLRKFPEFFDILFNPQKAEKKVRTTSQSQNQTVNSPSLIDVAMERQTALIALFWAQAIIESRKPIAKNVLMSYVKEEANTPAHKKGGSVILMDLKVVLTEQAADSGSIDRESVLRIKGEGIDVQNVYVTHMEGRTITLQALVPGLISKTLRVYDTPVSLYPSDPYYVPASMLRSLSHMRENIKYFRYFLSPQIQRCPTYTKDQSRYLKSMKALVPYLEVLTELNNQQLEALHSICSSAHHPFPFVLFGPPGTGKTRTISAAIRCLLLMNPKFRILICAPSNIAADRMAETLIADSETGFIENEQLLRLKSKHNSYECRDKRFDRIYHLDHKLKSFQIPRSFKQFRVVICTLSSSSHIIDRVDRGFFSHIFVDEAGQAGESELWIPIGGLADERTSVVLCGDPKQLGPVITLNLGDLLTKRFQSPLLRITRTPDYKNDKRLCVMLQDCFRCHQSIVSIASSLFYEGKLLPSPSPQQPCEQWRHLPKKGFPVLFVHVDGKESVANYSYYNDAEVDVVAEFVRHVHADFQFPLSDIGVISPYRAQTRRLRQKINREVAVDSVERFQGSERKIIIMSATRTGMSLGFIGCDLRLNTSITRAQHLLIVVGNRPALSNHPSWKGFIDYCAENNSAMKWNGGIHSMTRCPEYDPLRLRLGGALDRSLPQ